MIEGQDINNANNGVDGNDVQIKTEVQTEGLLNGAKVSDTKDNTVNITGEVEPETNTTVSKPDNIDASLWDEKAGVLKSDEVIKTLETQAKQIKDFRRIISKGTNAPEKVDDYAFEPSKDIEEMNFKFDDKVMDELKGIAFKNAMSLTQFNNFINGYLETLKSNGLIENPKSEEEIKKESEEFRSNEMKKLGSNPTLIIDGVANFINTQWKNGSLSETEKEILVNFADQNADNILVLNKIRLMTGEKEVPVISATNDGLPSDEQIAKEWSTYTNEQQMQIMDKRIKAGRNPQLPVEFFN